MSKTKCSSRLVAATAQSPREQVCLCPQNRRAEGKGDGEEESKQWKQKRAKTQEGKGGSS